MNIEAATYESCSIVVVTKSDKDLIAKYAKEAVELYYKLDECMDLLDPLTMVPLSHNKTAIKTFTKRLTKRIALLLVTPSDKVIGLNILITPHSNDNVLNIVHVSDFILNEDYRGLGYGKLFFLDSERIVKDRFPECKKITLGVLANNYIAYNLYKRLGFNERYIELYKTIRK